MGQPLSRHHRDIGAALVCAEAFQRVAEPFLARIAEDVKEGPQAPSRELGDLVAVASNLAFAVELYIKTLLAQLEQDVPRGHNLGKLYWQIPRKVRDEIEKSWREIMKRDWFGKRGIITFAKGAPDTPKWNDKARRVICLEDVLDRSGDVFSSWRYIYEFTEPNQGNYQFHHLEYGALISACEAIRNAINERLQGDRDRK
ncbi:MAG: HEPN domain-containing protein [Phycisphaerae bacterium]|nr:HEPN domain-containing protein [Phycisphaerae bacterium]